MDSVQHKRFDCPDSSSSDILHHSQQGKRNRVSKREIKDFSFNYLQETRFLVVVQDVRLK
jgi:hypothetical protein